MIINGKWYQDGRAANCDAALSINEQSYTLETEDQERSGKLQKVKVSDRLGNVERKLTLEDGSVFATSDNDAVDLTFKGISRSNSFIHALESHLGFAAIAVIATIFVTFAFFKWGVPWTSAKVAHALPHKTNQLIASHTLEFLDDYIFDDSKLEVEKTDQIREHFKSKLIHLEKNIGDVEFKLHFRNWSVGDEGIPNALALPSGDIILTDKFVELSESQNEIDAVLLHEMGHVIKRHSLEMVIEATLVTTIVMMVTGDSNGLADMGLGLGSLLVSSNYSRGHESEADMYAFEHMLIAKINPRAFSNIMNRMETYMQEPNEISKEVKGSKKVQKNSVLDYLSSHPSTLERVSIANRFSQCFKQKLLVCK